MKKIQQFLNILFISTLSTRREWEKIWYDNIFLLVNHLYFVNSMAFSITSSRIRRIFKRLFGLKLMKSFKALRISFKVKVYVFPCSQRKWKKAVLKCCFVDERSRTLKNCVEGLILSIFSSDLLKIHVLEWTELKAAQ